MMVKQPSTSFVDTIAARLVALCLALGIAIILAYNYRADFVQMFSPSSNETLPVVSSSSNDDITENNNPALAACLEQRLGDVDRMREEGILNESQYGSFRARAEDLCLQQHPG